MRSFACEFHLHVTFMNRIATAFGALVKYSLYVSLEVFSVVTCCTVVRLKLFLHLHQLINIFTVNEFIENTHKMHNPNLRVHSSML